MDPTNFYHLGQIRHQETLRQAENDRLAQSLRVEPTLWQRLRVRLSAGLSARLADAPRTQMETPCPEVAADCL